MNEKRVEALLGVLIDKISEQNTTIILKDYEIDRLKKSLAEAEELIKTGGEKPKEKN